MMKPRLFMVLAAIALGACTASEHLGPMTVLSDGGLRVTLTVEPKTIDAPGKAIAMLTYENTGADTVVLSSGAGCLSSASVYRDGKRIPFPSTEYFCTAVVTRWELEPGAELVVEWPLLVGGEHGIEVPAGTYRFVAMTNTGHGELEATFVVH